MLRWIFILLVKLYQWLISPLFPASCRHEPSCSNYMIQAIKIHGAIKGLWLGIKRLAKCHPWGTFGFDPVPKKTGQYILQKPSLQIRRWHHAGIFFSKPFVAIGCNPIINRISNGFWKKSEYVN
jgi:uncharacterized protein